MVNFETEGGAPPSPAPALSQSPTPAEVLKSIWNLLTSEPQYGLASQMFRQSSFYTASEEFAGSAKTACSRFHAFFVASDKSPGASPTPTPCKET